MPDSRSPADAVGEPGAAARLRFRVSGLATGLVAAALLLLVGAGLREALFDAFQRLLPAPPISPVVHVVVVDADSLRDVGGWPWSRFYLARLVEAIERRGALAIGIDTLFTEVDRSDPATFAALYGELPAVTAAEVRQLPSMDEAFARVIGRGPVVLARAGVRPGSFDFLPGAPAPLPPAATFDGAPPKDVLQFASVVANVPRIDGAALGHGLVNGDRDADGVVRRVPLVARAAGELTPGFALEVVRVAERAPRVALKSRRGRLERICAGPRCVPSTPDGQLQLRFGDWRRTRTTSAVNLLRRGSPPDLFKGQIVLVGVTAAAAADVAGTPAAREVPGVFVQAQAVDAVLRGSGLQRPFWAAAAEWGFALAMTLLAWVAVPRLSMTAVGVIAATVAGGALAASAFAFSNDLLLDPFPPLIPAAASSGAMIVLMYLEARRAQVHLRTALDAQRQQAMEHQRLLINELNHRVKNTLATVQSMAMQTLRRDRGPADARDAFVSRLMALSTAHNLLNTERWESADLESVVHISIAPFDDRPGARFTLQGPPVRMKAQHALSLALALQELGSNAVRFGALSMPGGRVDIRWMRAPDGEVRLRWQEINGPPVQPADHRGFGRRLIEEGLPRELGGQVRVELRPDGLRCEIRFRPAPVMPISDELPHG
jgi:two-component sensor histidine kinase